MKKTEFALPLLCLLVLLIPLTTAAAPESSAPGQANLDTAAIDLYLTEQTVKHGLPGAALAITEGDQIAYAKGYGTAGQGRIMTPQTPMYIGSQSKSFTALAIAQLAEAGKLDINSPVQTYVPWFAVNDAQASQTITLDHLIHHTSGLSESGNDVVLPEDTTLEQAVRSLSSARLTEPIGAKHQYFNLGYAVLMQVIENVSGQRYEDYVRQHIFVPLQMTHSYTAPDSAQKDGLAQGYSRFFGFAIPVRQPHRAYELGGGYLISTAEDMAHFAIAMNNDGVYQGARVLSSAWMSRLFAPEQGYGMGWYVSGDHIYHGGANEAFRSSVELYPARELGVVLLINEGYMIDHYVSGPQMLAGPIAIALGNPPPSVDEGWSVRTVGWGLLGLVLALCLLHVLNFSRLRDWRTRASRMSAVKLALDIAISFVIPTVILLVVYSQVKVFYGDRFNLAYQMTMLFGVLPDIGVLLIVGTVPDYAQGLAKLFWALTGQTRMMRAGERVTTMDRVNSGERSGQ